MLIVSEELLSYIWQHKKFNLSQLYTEEGLPIEIIDVGQKNPADGPDFLQARLRIDGKLWAGNIEIDVLQENWQLHKHHLNPRYNNVILHVIYQEEKNISPVYRSDSTLVPTLNLKKYVSQTLTNIYIQLQEKHTFIPCEKLFSLDHVPVGFVSSLLVERLIDKTTHFYTLYQQYLDWQEIFWVALAQGLGYPHNANAFMEIAQQLPFKIIQKYQQDSLNIEALLFGTAGLLNLEDIQEDYYASLKNTWLFLQSKHDLQSIVIHKIIWKGTRPIHFPTLQLMILAKIIHHYPELVKQGFEIKNIHQWYDLFDNLPMSHVFWDTHYTFTKNSHTKLKSISKNTVNTLLINTILPIQFLYYHHHDSDKINDILEIYESIPAEKNHIVDSWQRLGVTVKSAYDTQAWLQVYKKYCVSQKCVFCRIGANILS